MTRGPRRRNPLSRGAEAGISRIAALRLRVGWLVHADVIPLNQGFYLSGPSERTCRSQS
jgi:hypothetical protein